MHSLRPGRLDNRQSRCHDMAATGRGRPPDCRFLLVFEPKVELLVTGRSIDPLGDAQKVNQIADVLEYGPGVGLGDRRYSLVRAIPSADSRTGPGDSVLYLTGWDASPRHRRHPLGVGGEGVGED